MILINDENSVRGPRTSEQPENRAEDNESGLTPRGYGQKTSKWLTCYARHGHSCCARVSGHPKGRRTSARPKVSRASHKPCFQMRLRSQSALRRTETFSQALRRRPFGCRETRAEHWGGRVGSRSRWPETCRTVRVLGGTIVSARRSLRPLPSDGVRSGSTLLRRIWERRPSEPWGHDPSQGGVFLTPCREAIGRVQHTSGLCIVTGSLSLGSGRCIVTCFNTWRHECTWKAPFPWGAAGALLLAPSPWGEGWGEGQRR